MPTPVTTYVSNAVLLQDVARALKFKSAADLPAEWQETVNNANQQAVADLTAILEGKGYTQADIDGYDDRVSFNRRLGLWYALKLGNPLGGYPEHNLDALDPREFLRSQGVIRIGGVAKSPGVGASEVGGISFGQSQARADLERQARCNGWFS